MDSTYQTEVGKFDPFRNIDWTYEFSAPKYYDFTYEETDADVLAAERWFELAIPYENSPHVSKTKSIPELQSTARGRNHGGKLEALQILAHVSPLPNRKNGLIGTEDLSENCTEEYSQQVLDCAQDDTNFADMSADCQEDTDVLCKVPTSNCLQEEPFTPVGRSITGVIENNANRTPPSALAALVISPGSLPAKRLYSDAWKEPPPRPAPRSISKNRLSFSRSGRKKASANKKPIIASFKFYAQPEKKQKLEGERLQKLLYMKDRLPRPKNPPTLTVPHEFQFRTDERAHTHPVESSKASPFVSMAERVRRFHLKTPERFHNHSNNSINETKILEYEKGKPKLTVAKSPAFGTSQRIRPPRVKSTAEIEEEMLAKMPKFKARPLPKKILEAPVLPTFSKSVPHTPEFQEFHLHTMERAQHHASSASSSSGDSVCASGNVSKPKDFTKIRPPQLQTASRVRPSTVKSSKELEEEELAKMPKFKARPLNKMIFESKGDLGVHRNQKKEVTMPQEFHLRTDERAHSRDPDLLADQIQRLAITKPSKGEKLLRPTIPKPFHLATDDRGLAKGMREIQERIRKQLEESRARIPIANPLPLTTEIPDIPSKPVPKECTKPEPFYLESLLLHEQEQERLAQERIQAEQLSAALREFHAQPNLSKVPAVLPEMPRKALTTIEEFNLLVDQRAVERGEFDKKVAEKQMQYKRYREMYEAAKKAEEERFLKAMRKEMIPTARPMPAFPRPRLPLRSTKEPTKPMSPQFSKKTVHKER